MKSLKYLFPALLVLLSIFTACNDDESNYVYLTNEEAGEIKFDTIGIADRYALSRALNIGDHIEYEPNVTYKYPERLRYRWFVLKLTDYSYQPTQEGNALVYPPADTLSHSKKLDWVVDLEPGQYRFHLLAEDSISGMRAYYRPGGNYTVVNGSGTRAGLYLLSEINGETDIEVMSSELMLVCEGDNNLPRYYSELSGHTLPGKPKFIQATHAGSTYKEAYLVCTDQNLYRINQVDMVIMDEWNEMFYNTPEVFNPQCAYFTNNCDFLINDGKLHTLYTNMANDRKFSAPIAGDYDAAEYLMFESKSNWYPTPDAIDADQVIYDKKNNKFRPYFNMNSSVGSFKATTGDVIYADANKLPADPKVILNCGSNQTYCILEDGGKNWLYRFNFYDRVDEGSLEAEGAKSKIDLSGCQDLSNAKLFASCASGHAFYYATDNAVHSFSPSSGESASRLVYKCEANETVTSIYACGSVGGGWPTSNVIFWIAVWDSSKQEGKLLEYEMDHSYGVPMEDWCGMVGHSNPYVTTGWGKIVDMTFLDAE